MYLLETEELLIILRALYFYEDKLTNQADNYRNPDEWDNVIWLRRQLGNKLKLEARID
jgi:hypothetical protein